MNVAGFATPSVQRLKGLSAYGQPFVRLAFILYIIHTTTDALNVCQVLDNIANVPACIH